MEEYNELVEAFTKLSSNTKRDEILYEVQELFALFHTLTGGNETLLATEMNEYESGLGEEEFLNSIYAYLISTKENIGRYLDK